MATLAMMLSALIAWHSWKRYRRLNKSRDPIQKKVFEQVCVISASLAIVLIFYHTLLGLLAFGWEWITIQHLEAMEGTLRRLNQFVEAYKPSWPTWVFWAFLLYLIGAMWIRFLSRDTPFEFTKKIKLGLQIVNTTIFFLAAFTVLGFQPGEAATTLEIHLQEIRKDHGLFQQDLADALVGSTLNEIYQKTIDAFPDSQATKHLMDTALSEGAKLQEKFREMPRRRVSGELNQALRRVRSRARPLAEVVENPRPSVEPDVKFWFFPLPAEATYRKVQRARESLRTFAERTRPRIIRFLKRPGGKELVLELPKGAIDQIAKVLDPIAEVHPMLKPVIEVLKNTANEALKTRLKSKLEKLSGAAIRNSTNLDQSLSETSREIADSTKIEVPPKREQEYRNEVANLRHEIAEIRRIVETPETAHQSSSPHSRAIPPRPPRVPDPVQSSGPEVVPYSPIESPWSGGGSGYASSTGGCICNHYRNGALISSVTIPIGAKCGSQVCGRDIPPR